MITRCENSSTSLAKARNALTICGTQAITIIDGEKPKLIEIGCVEHAQRDIVACFVGFSIARSDLECIATSIFERGEMFAKQGKSVDVPIVFD